jgi:hypothetical protein
MEVGLPQDMRDALSTFDTAASEIVTSFIAPLDIQEPPAVVYHYTNDVGLRGILETGRLWLSDIFSLNDPSELRHGISRAVNILKSKAENGPPETKRFAEDFAAFLESGVESSAHFFVVSFSLDGDELGQWRAYADNGHGYALGFDGRALEETFIKENGVRIPNCSTFHVMYDDDDVLAGIHRRIIESMFHLISLPRGKRLGRATINAYMRELGARLSQHVLTAALFFKHKAYKNEKEFRFLQIYMADVTPPDVKRRYRSYEIVKYREFDWRRIKASALKRIIVGPATDRGKGTRFAEDCLVAFGAGAVKVTPSSIPYRAVR